MKIFCENCYSYTSADNLKLETQDNHIVAFCNFCNSQLKYLNAYELKEIKEFIANKSV